MHIWKNVNMRNDYYANLASSIKFVALKIRPLFTTGRTMTNLTVFFIMALISLHGIEVVRGEGGK